MVVNSVQDMGGMPATSNPAPAPETKTEPEPKTPKPSTIKIQSPPAKEEKKDEMAVLALRQASQEAASQAKNKGDEKKIPSKADESAATASPTVKAHRGSVAPELPDTAPDSPKTVKRPAMVVPEDAAVSSANFHVENAEMLGLVQHHRGSIISATDEREQDKVVKEIRQSISGDHQPGDVEALRKEAALKHSSEDPVVEEKEGEEGEESAEVEGAEKKADEKEKAGEEKADEKEKAQDEEKEDDKKEDKKDKDAAEEESKTEAVSASKE
jgi:hypothetical protein